MNIFNKLLIFIVFFSLTISCSKIDPVTGEKVIIEPNAGKRAEAERDKGGGLFGDINSKKKNRVILSLQHLILCGGQP